MTSDATGAGLTAVLDALTLVQGQLDTIVRSNARIEATHQDILHRLDTIDAGQAGLTDLLPVLEMILARSIEDRDINRAGFSRTAELAAFAYAAAMGNPSPLPVDLADDPLLERFTLAQPANMVSRVRALVEWRRVVGTVDTAELAALLTRQYQPSPSDTAETRVLRYQLAAITRAEIEGRGAAPPMAPSTTTADDRSAEARAARSRELARLWRGGESAALFAEPELAGALDLFARAEQQIGMATEEQFSADLAGLHRLLGDRLEAGERPVTGDARAPNDTSRGYGPQPGREP